MSGPEAGGPDAAARRAVRHRIGTTEFVEAGAGTGKTTALVSRLLSLVLVGGARMGEVAAITFTEAAAGELRDRVAEALEQAAGGRREAHLLDPVTGEQAAEQRDRAAAAVEALDEAAIVTLHGMARRVLSEHPFDAGLPPVFEVSDEIRSQAALGERWADFVRSAPDHPLRRRAVGYLAAAGVGLDRFLGVARLANDNWDLLESARPAPPGPGAPRLDRVLGAARRALDRRGDCTDPGDKLLAHLARVADLVAELAQAEPGADEVRLLAAAPDRKLFATQLGRREAWHGSKAVVTEALEEAEEARWAVLSDTVRPAAALLVEDIAADTLAAAERRRREGRLEYHDLLVLARRLLRHSEPARRALHERYRHVLVDEFQDTDPIQAELAVRIAGDPATSGSPDWHDVEVEPGHLFFVGDPQQAIYGFRRADVRLFLELRDQLVDSPLRLTVNHRSVPGLIDWVNGVFARLIGEGTPGVQPSFTPLAPHRPAPAGDDAGPAVTVLGDAGPGGIDAVRRREAAAICEAIARVRTEGWAVGDGVERRPATYADIAVLVPRRTGLAVLEDALERASVPYRLETSTFVYQSAEVRQLLGALRAVDDPTDDVAIVGTLRSPLFACGDDDLLEHAAAGGRWDYRRPAPDAVAAGPVARALGALAGLHDRRWWTDASGLVEALLDSRRALELALGQRRYRDEWRRLRFVADQARRYADTFGGDLRHYLDWVDEQAQEGVRVNEAILPESDLDAVRILTVHAAKGLEFPVVVLAGLNATGGVHPSLPCHLTERGVEFSLFQGRLATPGFAEAAEAADEREEAERIRLLYVGATRARDHLVVSCFHPDTAPGRATLAGRLLEACEAAPERWARPPDTATPAPRDRADGGPVRPPDSWGERRAWAEARAELLEVRGQPTVVSATGVADWVASGDRRMLGRAHPDDPALDKDPTEDDGVAPAWRRGRAGTSVGRAAHAVLQLVDLCDPGDLDALVTARCVDEGVEGAEGRVASLVRAALDWAPLAEAVRHGRYWRELYVGAPVGGGVLEGYIDLLIDGPDGLHVVDYKTDQVADDRALDVRATGYAPQGAAYAVAVEAALGRPVVQCTFLFLTPAAALPRPVVDLGERTAEVRRLMAQLGRPAAADRP